jgi:hypothetical protein
MNQITRDPRELEAATIDMLQTMFELIRATALHGEGDALVAQSADALALRIARAQPPFALTVFSDAVLRDRMPLYLELEAFRRVQQLAGALRRWNAQELVFECVPELDALIVFARAVITATHVNRAARRPNVVGIALASVWRPHAAHSPAAEAALEVYAGVQLTRACAAVEPLCAPAGAWPWPEAQALCARLERLTASNASAAARALELEKPPWSVARQCIALPFYVGAVLARMQVGVHSQRAIVHAALALGCHGIGEGLALPDAARAALARVLDRGGRRSDPHQLRTCALLAALADPQPSVRLELAGLLHAAYDVELQRTLAVAGVQQSRADLHAWLAASLGTRVHAGWGRALLSVLGLVPAGSHVIADGRLGIVLGPGRDGDPFRPRVLLGGVPANPTEPVQLHSPLAMTPWLK